MSMTVVGLYDDEAAARKATNALKEHGFEDNSIHIEAHGADDESTFVRDGDLFTTLTNSGVPRDEAEFYAEGVRRGGSLLILEAEEGNAQRAAELMQVHEPVTREEREKEWRQRGYTGYDRNQPAYTREQAEAERTERLTEAKEELRVGKREVAAGGVRVHKRVHERPVEETVHLREEHVEVDRRPGSKTAAMGDDLFEEKTIEMRETREEAVVNKETKVTGEVVISKEARDRQETIRETLREVEVEVERLGATGLTNDFDEHRAFFRQHCGTTFGQDRYDEYEPAYLFGFNYGGHERLMDYEYDDAEPALRQRYEKKHGEGTFERVKDAIRSGYDRARTSVTA